MAGKRPAGSSLVMMKHPLLLCYAAMAAASLMAVPLWARLGIDEPLPALLPLQFYQHVLSQRDGKTCPSYPSCSHYAEQAVRRHGLLIGSWLMLDRIMHEPDDLQKPTWVRVHGMVRSYDPLARNDFWLRGRKTW
jgi:hypothetical protein